MHDIEPQNSGNFDVETPDIPLPEIQEKIEIPDEKKSAFRFAFVGSGQGGSRIAACFYTLGYRRVCAINTAQQDLATLQLPEANKLAIDDGGAGKNPAAAKQCFDAKAEDVLDFMRRSFGPVYDRTVVCIGAGGGCVSGDNVVYTTYCGGETLESLWKRVSSDRPVWRHPEGHLFTDISDLNCQTLSLRDDGTIGFSPVLQVWRTTLPAEQQRLVTFKNGVSQQVSQTHKFACVKHGQIEWVESMNLTPGTIVTGAVTACWPVNHATLKLASFSLNADIGWLTGTLCGNGHLCRNEEKSDFSVCLTDSCPAVLEKFESFCAALGGSSAGRSAKPGCWLSRIYGQTAAKNAAVLTGLPFGHKGQWKIPEWVWKSPKEVACAFLSGWFDADGNVAKKGFEASISTVSRPAANGLAILLNLLGLKASVHERAARKNEQTCFEVRLRTKPQLVEFEALISPHLRKKKSALAAAIARRESGGQDLALIPFSDIQHCCTALGLASVKRGNKLGGMNIGTWTRNGFVRQQTALHVLDYLEAEASKLALPACRIGQNTTLQKISALTGLSRSTVQRAARSKEHHLFDRCLAATESQCAEKRKSVQDIIKKVRFWRAHLRGFQQVVNITSCAFKQLFDLTVAGTSNYFAGTSHLLAAHNTGAGTVVGLVRKAEELQIANKCSSQKVGVIVALPKITEGKKPNANAYWVLKELFGLTVAGVVSPLIVLDNERISALYPGLPVDPFWQRANLSICALFDLFNTICVQHSTYTAFDPADFSTILDSGLIVFGATPVTKWQEAGAISFAIRDNLKRNILSGGVNLSTGNIGAAIVIASRNILNQVPHEHLDQAFDQLTRTLRSGSTVHRGIYSGSKENMTIYTALGGLDDLDDKFAELKRLGDVISTEKTGIGTVLGEH